MPVFSGCFKSRTAAGCRLFFDAEHFSQYETPELRFVDDYKFHNNDSSPSQRHLVPHRELMTNTTATTTTTQQGGSRLAVSSPILNDSRRPFCIPLLLTSWHQPFHEDILKGLPPYVVGIGRHLVRRALHYHNIPPLPCLTQLFSAPKGKEKWRERKCGGFVTPLQSTRNAAFGGSKNKE